MLTLNLKDLESILEALKYDEWEYYKDNSNLISRIEKAIKDWNADKPETE